jgi:hypothetical protein
MKNRLLKNSFCIFIAAIFFGALSQNLTAQRFIPTDSNFQIGVLSPSFGPLVSPEFDKFWELKGGPSMYAILPLTKYSSIRVGIFDINLAANYAESRIADFTSITTYGSIIPFHLEWVPKVIISPEIGLGFTSIKPSDELRGVASGSETEMLIVAGFQLHTTAFGRLQPVLSAQYFRVFTYFEYDFTQISMGLRYSFTPPKRVINWWRAK